MASLDKSFALFVLLASAAGCSSSDTPGTGPAASSSSTSTGSGGKGGNGGATGAAGSSATGGVAGTSSTGGAGGAPTDGGGTGGAGGANDASADIAVSSDSSPDDDAIADATSDVVAPMPPPMLSATGFFKSIGADGGIVPADGVRPYAPRYPLWSDGADKLRWVYLPPGTKIDNTDQDHWVVPVGTKFWKEFSIGGTRLETRLIERFGPGPDDFFYATYYWAPTDAGAEPKDAVLVPPTSHVLNAKGTDHDIPFEEHCHRCHDPLKEHVLGFSAFQLSPAGTAPAGFVTIKTLNDEGLLKVATPNGFTIPGKDAMTRDVLGYLHANCGNCHNDTPGVAIPAPKMVLKVLVSQKTAEETGAYTTAVNIAVTKPDHTANPLTVRIVGGDPTTSSLYWRMQLRGMTNDIPDPDQMPPVATEHPDTTALPAVSAWIRSLPPPRDK